MFRFDPATKQIKHLGDLTEACGEKDMKAVAQGKIHNNFVECQGKLYFATHTGYYAIIDDMEKIGPPPPGWKPYQGGHFLAYDMATGKFEDFGIALPRRGHHHHEHGHPPRPALRADLAHRPFRHATTWPRRK